MNKRVNGNSLNTLARSYAEYRQELINTQGDAKGLSLCLMVLDAMVSLTADVLQDDNERFNRDRFFKAVYGGYVNTSYGYPTSVA